MKIPPCLKIYVNESIVFSICSLFETQHRLFYKHLGILSGNTASTNELSSVSIESESQGII